jgi:hypothetical protein
MECARAWSRLAQEPSQACALLDGTTVRCPLPAGGADEGKELDKEVKLAGGVATLAALTHVLALRGPDGSAKAGEPSVEEVWEAGLHALSALLGGDCIEGLMLASSEGQLAGTALVASIDLLPKSVAKEAKEAVLKHL